MTATKKHKIMSLNFVCAWFFLFSMAQQKKKKRTQHEKEEKKKLRLNVVVMCDIRIFVWMSGNDMNKDISCHSFPSPKIVKDRLPNAKMIDRVSRKINTTKKKTATRIMTLISIIVFGAVRKKKTVYTHQIIIIASGLISLILISICPTADIFKADESDSNV